MTDRPQWHPAALFAALFLISVLFAVAGLINLLKIVEIELSFFQFIVNSTLSNLLWIVISLIFAVIFGYILRDHYLKR